MEWLTISTFIKICILAFLTFCMVGLYINEDNYIKILSDNTKSKSHKIITITLAIPLGGLLVLYESLKRILWVVAGIIKFFIFTITRFTCAFKMMNYIMKTNGYDDAKQLYNLLTKEVFIRYTCLFDTPFKELLKIDSQATEIVNEVKKKFLAN